MLSCFAELKRKAQARTGRCLPIIVIQEAGLDGFWIHRVLQAEGIESHVVDPASIATSRRRRRAKTDKLDGEALLQALLAYKRGEPRVCAMLRAPTLEEEALALGAKIVGNARPLPQFNDDGIGDGKRSEATQIGAQGRGHHLGVAAVILGACQREAIHLLRIDDVNLDAALDQCLDHGAVRDLDRDMDLAGLGNAARCHQPGRHLGETLAAVPENFLADPAAVLVRQENMIGLARPIDACVPLSFISHPRSPLEKTSRRNLRRSLYWRSVSGLHVRRGLPTGHRSRPIHRGTRPPR